MKRNTILVLSTLVLGVAGMTLHTMSDGIATNKFNAPPMSEAELSKFAPSDPLLNVATFAGGCFWCVEAAFEEVPGVVEAVSGYSGGSEHAPSYKQVSSGATGHTESVQVYYDPSEITYEGLLQAFWRMMDPTDAAGQFSDRGEQYRPEIFFHDDIQRQAAELSKEQLATSDRYKDQVVINISRVASFYPAEEYHQDYYKKKPRRYHFYTRNSGRYQFIDRIWKEDREVDFSAYRPVDGVQYEGIAENVMNQGDAKTNSMSNSKALMDRELPSSADSFKKPSDEALKALLSPLAYEVTQKDGTERPFDNPLHDEKRAGIYVDVVSGEPLFSSTDKYDSKTGWPSFSRPINADVVVEKEDLSLFGKRIEIRSAIADSHLGHVFNDGPAPTGLRYCMNSAAMRFIPKEKMVEEGYGDYLNR